MTTPTFLQLNRNWNADPNVPEPVVREDGNDVLLEFYVNALLFEMFREDEKGRLRFRNVSKYRLGRTNDEGWYRGQCRYSKMAPGWGEFYEIAGADPAADAPLDWKTMKPAGSRRHFLFYLRDDTFEAFADDWVFDAGADNALLRLTSHETGDST